MLKNKPLHDSTAQSDPRIVIRGESNPDRSQSAIVDWLNFTFHLTSDTAEFIRLQNKLGAAFGFTCSSHLKQGFLGYHDSWELGDGFGRMATGGTSQRGTTLVSVNADGCMATRDWSAVHQLLVELKAKITRVDLAHDDFEGIFDIRAAFELYASGEFGGSGRPPQLKSINDHDSGKGKTIYVGNRENGKLLRVYEKGKQLGESESPWVRWELELHNRNRQIPLEVLLRPGDFLAGGYPGLAWVSERQDRIRTTREKMRLNYEQLVQHCSRSYGKLLWVMAQELNIPADQVIERLAVKGAPSRLLMPTVASGDPSYQEAE